MITPAEIQHIKQSVDIFDLASRYTELRKKARSEWDGPCPVCGGNKRFVVNAVGWWFCRDCHEKRGDAIELVRFAEGCDFATACQRLGARELPPVQAPSLTAKFTPRAVRWNTPRWQQQAYELVEGAAVALESTEGAPGREYLQQRGIEQYTWRVWLLGYSSDSPPWNKEQRRHVGGPSITIPYLRHDDDRILAVRYRRIDPNEDRYINKAGSACMVHGAHLIDLNADTLVITEGEINALSIWQAAHDLGVTVVSIGSQSPSVHTFTAVERLSKKFTRCIAWCDEPATALEMRTRLLAPHVLLVQSPKPNGSKVDANDMLQRGLLRAFVERKLEHFDTRRAA